MKRMFLLLMVLCTLFTTKPVYASVVSNINFTPKNTYWLANSASQSDKECKDSYLGDPKTTGSVAYYLQTALDIIKYAGIVLCIVLTIYEFAKAILSEDKDILKPLVKKAFTRLVLVAMLFFLPIIVDLLLSLIGAYGTCGIK